MTVPTIIKVVCGAREAMRLRFESSARKAVISDAATARIAIGANCKAANIRRSNQHPLMSASEAEAAVGPEGLNVRFGRKADVSRIYLLKTDSALLDPNRDRLFNPL